MKLKKSLKDSAKRHFCTVYDYARKADLSNGYWNLKR